MKFNDFLNQIKKIVSVRELIKKETDILFVDYNTNKPNVFSCKVELKDYSDDIINDDFDSVYDIIIQELYNCGKKSLKNDNDFDVIKKEKGLYFLKNNINLTSHIQSNLSSDIKKQQMIEKINRASNHIAIEGRVGPYHFIICNSNNKDFMELCVNNKQNINVIQYDNIIHNDEIIVGRINGFDQPGLTFLYYIENNKVWFQIRGIGIHPEKQYILVKF